MASFRSLKSEVFEREERKLQYQSYIRGLNAYDRHKKFVKDYIDFYGKEKDARPSLPIKTDQDTLREGYRFILSDEDMDSSWEKRLVKRYYDKLFKEYCIADMSQYKKGKSKVLVVLLVQVCNCKTVKFLLVPGPCGPAGATVKLCSFITLGVLDLLLACLPALIGLRWRTEKEVISGKGQFVCGNRECNEKDNLGSYEVNFSYFEGGESKQALVKLVACKRCAEKLVYKRLKEKEQAKAKEEAKVKEKGNFKRKREMDAQENSMDGEYGRNDTRKKGHETSSSMSRKANDDENFEEFLEGMFP